MFSFLNKIKNVSGSLPRKSAFVQRNSAPSERVYLDNAGATPISARAKAELLRALEVSGNPSAIYQEGVVAKNLLSEAKEKIGKIINARAHEIYFTGSGTESCNLAILGTYFAWKKENEYSTKLPHIIISSIEHSAIMEVVNYLSINSLANVTYLPVYENGIVKVEDIRKAITDETILVSVMYANNEIGTVQPIKEIGRMIQEVRNEKKEKFQVSSFKFQENTNADPDANSRSEFASTENWKLKTGNYPIFHADACQAGNYLNLDVFRLKVDLMTLNSSKVYGPKGVGMLYKKEGVKIEPISFGGGQERGLRSGTENVPSVYAFACALEEAQEVKEKENTRLTEIRDYFKNKLSEKIKDISFYGAFDNDRLPNNINCRIPGIPSDEMIIRLDQKGFAVSHKSACASQVDDSSYVIKALGAKESEAKENIRITMGRETTKEDMDNLLDAIVEIRNKFGR